MGNDAAQGFKGEIRVTIQDDGRMTLLSLFARYFSPNPVLTLPIEETHPHALLFPNAEAFDSWVDSLFLPSYDLEGQSG